MYIPSKKKWSPACVPNKDFNKSTRVCSMLGYSAVNSSRFISSDSNVTVQRDLSVLWRSSQKNRNKNFLREYSICGEKNGNDTFIELTCSNFECGKIKSRQKRPQTRIIGGKQSVSNRLIIIN